MPRTPPRDASMRILAECIVSQRRRLTSLMEGWSRIPQWPEVIQLNRTTVARSRALGPVEFGTVEQGGQ
jgi:hypothetical protein